MDQGDVDKWLVAINRKLGRGSEFRAAAALLERRAAAPPRFLLQDFVQVYKEELAQVPRPRRRHRRAARLSSCRPPAAARPPEPGHGAPRASRPAPRATEVRAAALGRAGQVLGGGPRSAPGTRLRGPAGAAPPSPLSRPLPLPLLHP